MISLPSQSSESLPVSLKSKFYGPVSLSAPRLIATAGVLFFKLTRYHPRTELEIGLEIGYFRVLDVVIPEKASVAE